MVVPCNEFLVEKWGEKGIKKQELKISNNLLGASKDAR